MKLLFSLTLSSILLQLLYFMWNYEYTIKIDKRKINRKVDRIKTDFNKVQQRERSKLQNTLRWYLL